MHEVERADVGRGCRFWRRCSGGTFADDPMSVWPLGEGPIAPTAEALF